MPMLPVRVTPLLTLGKDISGIQLQMPIAKGNKKRLCILSTSDDPKKYNSWFSLKSYNH